MQKMFKASCLCGNIKFEACGFSTQAAHCHCTMCRKFHGAAFGTLVAVKKLLWTSGEQLLKTYTAPNGTARTFCSQCGSSLAFRANSNPTSQWEVAVATFDEAIPVKPDAHIYTNYKANWCAITDELPQFPEGR